MEDVDQRRSSTAPRYAGALMLAAVAGHLLSETATGLDDLAVVGALRHRRVPAGAVGVRDRSAEPAGQTHPVALGGVRRRAGRGGRADRCRRTAGDRVRPGAGARVRTADRGACADVGGRVTGDPGRGAPVRAAHGRAEPRLPHGAVVRYSAPGNRGAIALRSSWSSQELREVGPHPDVWLPDSTTETAEVVRRTDGIGSAVRIVPGASVAFSPVVLAVPTPVAEDVVSDAPEKWGALLTKVAATGLAIGRPNPLTTADGGSAMHALYESLEPAVVERRVEESTRLSPTAATITTEQMLLRHNKTSCAQQPCLTALYPADTYRADYPLNLVEWDAPDTSNHAARAPARAFQAWLATPEGMTALNGAGLAPVPAGRRRRVPRGVRRAGGPRPRPRRGRSRRVRVARVPAPVRTGQTRRPHLAHARRVRLDGRADRNGRKHGSR